MNIKMTGIDHSMAGVDIRQSFAFTGRAMAEAVHTVLEIPGVDGCVILSTCNRTELWLSLKEREAIDLPGLLCGLKSLEEEQYRKYLRFWEGEEAIRHLFYLAAGLKSQIVGEDQILTQVKEALSFAREQEGTDHGLEVLFRMAVTAGKQVKTEVPMDKANFSAAHQAIAFLKERRVHLKGKQCLVIGNGEMGKITAQALMEEGAQVTVTVRQYRSGIVKIPQGAKRIHYGERYGFLPQCDLVMSATASPNYTITREELERCQNQGQDCREQIFVDLAVPRDIEPAVGTLPKVSLYDIDTFHISPASGQREEQYRRAEEILKKGVQEFLDWQNCRELIPRIQTIGEEAAMDLCWRMEKDIKKLGISEIEKKRLEKHLAQSAEKVVDKLMFALRDKTDADVLKQCVEILEQVY